MSGVSVITSMGQLTDKYLSKPDTNNLINALKPDNGYYYITQDSENWDPIAKNYSRNTTWTLDTYGEAVSGIPLSINNTN